MVEEIFYIIPPNVEPETIMQVTCNKPVKLNVLLTKLQETTEDYQLLNYVQEDGKEQTILTQKHLEEYLRVPTDKRPQLCVVAHKPEEENYLAYYVPSGICHTYL